MTTNTSGIAARIIVTLVSGSIVGILAVTYAISFSTIAFVGEFAPLLDRAIGIGLFSAAVMASVISVTATYPGTIGGPQDIAAAVLALALGSAAMSLPTDASADQVFAMAYSTLAIASALTATAFLVLGYFRLGNLARFIPYPVMAGFLAATGWLLIKGALGLMTGAPLGWNNLERLADTGTMFVWVPGIALGLLMLSFVRRFRQPLLIPGLVGGTLVLFYLTLTLSGLTPDDARQAGWLLGPFPGQGFAGSIDPTLVLAAGVWPDLRTLTEIITVMLISVFGMLLNVSGVEAATRQSIDLNRDLISSSLANFAACLGGGIVGYQQLSLTVLANRLGANNRFVGLIAACVCALAFFFGASVLGYVPKILVGGIVAFLGFDLLLGFLLQEWKKLPLVEFTIIVLIVAVAASIGFLEGIAIGIIAGMTIFIITYSKIGIVRQELRCDGLRSNVERSSDEAAILKQHGAGTVVLELQGYLFFGTASQFFEAVRQKVSDPRHGLNHAIVNFRRVTGLDSSAIDSFVKLARFMQDHHVELIFTGLPDSIETRLRASDISVRTFQNLDSGIEWCEQDMLDRFGRDLTIQKKSLVDILANDCFTPAEARTALEYLEVCSFDPGEFMLKQGSQSNDILFIEEGRVTVQLNAFDREVRRLRAMAPGTSVGEIGHYLELPRTASVVADQPCRAWRLTEAAMARMEREQPALAVAFHKFMARRLSQKLADTTRLLDSILH